MISELRHEVEERDEFFRSALEAAGGSDLAVDSAHRRPFAGICAAPYESELDQSISPELGDKGHY
jgi:hypothetical protein